MHFFLLTSYENRNNDFIFANFLTIFQNHYIDIWWRLLKLLRSWKINGSSEPLRAFSKRQVRLLQNNEWRLITCDAKQWRNSIAVKSAFQTVLREIKHLHICNFVEQNILLNLDQRQRHKYCCIACKNIIQICQK